MPTTARFLFMFPAVAAASLAIAAQTWGETPPVWNAQNVLPAGETLHAVAGAGNHAIAVGDNGRILTSFDGIDWSIRDSDTEVTLRALVHAAGRIVVVGDGGTILSSEDSETWTLRPSGTTHALRSVAYGGGRFVAVGDSGTILFSETGIDWEEAESGTTTSLQGIAYGDGRFVAAGVASEAFSSANGVDWTSEWASGGSFTSVAFGGGDFVLAREFGGVWTSVNGGEWVSQSTPPFASLAYDPAINGFFGARPVNDGGIFARHPVSLLWQAIESLPLVPPLRGIAANGGRIIAVGDDGFVLTRNLSVPTRIEDSVETDLQSATFFEDRIHAVGRTGTIASVRDDRRLDVRGEGGDRRVWNGVAGGADRMVAVGRDGTIAYSDDGSEWRLPWSTLAGRPWRIVHEGGSFHVVGDEGLLWRSEAGLDWDVVETGSDANLCGMARGNGVWAIVGQEGAILTSTDGSEWTERTSGVSANLRDVAHGGSGFVAVGDAGTLLKSETGEAWSAHSIESPQLAGVAYGNGRYVIIGGSGDRVVSLVSENAGSWERFEVPVFSAARSLDFQEGRFIATGAGGAILTSEDGEKWTVEASAYSPSLWSLTESGDGSLAAVGETGTVIHRPEAGEWEPVEALTSRRLWNVAAGSGSLVAVGDRGVVLRAVDGSEWTVARLPDDGARLGGVTFGAGKFVAVGEDGIVLTSPTGEVWQEGELPEPAMYWAVEYGNGGFVAVGEGGRAARSLDGIEWEPVTIADFGEEAPVSFHSVRYKEGIGYVVAGGEGFLAFSGNGLTWENAVLLGERSWEGLATGTGWYVAVGVDGAIGLSFDGRDWEIFDEGDGASLYAVTAGEWGASAVGVEGAMRDFALPGFAHWLSGTIEADPGDDVLLAPRVGGTPPLDFDWSRDGEPISSGTEPAHWLTDVRRRDIGDYRVQANNAAGSRLSEPVLLVVKTHYGEWQEARFADPSHDAAAPGADPLGAGVPNLLLYALELDPDAPRRDLPQPGTETILPEPEPEATAAAGIETLATGDGETFLTLTYPRAIGATDVELIPEASGDFSTWDSLPEANVVRVVREGTREWITVRDNHPMSETGGKRFLRLRVQFAQ